MNNKILVVESHACTCLQRLGVLGLEAAAEKGNLIATNTSKSKTFVSEIKF